MRVCAVPGCPNLIEKPGRCKDHRRQAEQQRGSRQARGYDRNHDRERLLWVPRVATGKIICWRCGELILAGEAWDLGHDDIDRSKYRGPEHANQCNRSAGGRAAHH